MFEFQYSVEFDMNTAMVSLTFEILKICLVYAYFFKHLGLSMPISFMLIKKEGELITEETY